jgi:hypothetical protein
MGKRVDHNATQDISASMLVPEKKPPPVASKNDASMWLSQPVGADDFRSAPSRPTAPKSGVNWIVPVSAVVFLAMGGFGVWYGLLRKSAPETSPGLSTPGSGSSSSETPTAGSAAMPATTALTVDAGVAALDAASATGDAGTAPAAVDAISGADPAIKNDAQTPVTKTPPKKKRPVTKRVTKKKTAPTPAKTRK